MFFSGRTADATAPTDIIEYEPRAKVDPRTTKDPCSHRLEESLRTLASISHDLLTPITRMRLRVDALDESTLQQKIVADLREMEHLVREGMSYVRGTLGCAEDPVKVDPMALLEGLVFDNQDMGRPVTLSTSIGGQLRTRPRALRRALGNLIDNALKYGKTAEVGSHRDTTGALCITVSDQGPGIPECELAKVLQPFYRMAASRHSDIGGAGLGLAIVDQLIRSIEGNLTLSNRDGGGLIATVVLP
jgi:signal transduction histidine kinase